MNTPRPSKGGGGSIRDQKLLAWCDSAILRCRASSLKNIISQKLKTDFSPNLEKTNKPNI